MMISPPLANARRYVENQFEFMYRNDRAYAELCTTNGLPFKADLQRAKGAVLVWKDFSLWALRPYSLPLIPKK